MRAMADEKKQRQEQIEEDAKEMARLDADINAHIKPKLVGAKPWNVKIRGQAALMWKCHVFSFRLQNERASSGSSASAQRASQ